MTQRSELVEESAATVAAAGLVYVTDSIPGIRRVREGDGFAYYLPDRRSVSDEAELARIARLAVPPAYEDVWICRNPRGHLQATGRDARGRKQYRYHAEWRVHRDKSKFDRMAAFGAALPRLRRRLSRDLARPGLPREKVLAVIVRILDETSVRIGNAEYARSNDSYGLTTLRNRHVKFIRDGRLRFHFRGKGGAEHEVPIDDKRLARIVRHCHQLPGQRLFQYVDDEGALHPIESDQVNGYLKEAMGDDFTAKDFRTWGATLRAIEVLNGTPLPERRSERALNGCIVGAVKQVAAELRNTPAVCRKSYINPVVFSAWRDGELHEAMGEAASRAPRRMEQLALVFLKKQVSRDTAKRPRRTRPALPSRRTQPRGRKVSAGAASSRQAEARPAPA